MAEQGRQRHDRQAPPTRTGACGSAGQPPRPPARWARRPASRARVSRISLSRVCMTAALSMDALMERSGGPARRLLICLNVGRDHVVGVPPVARRDGQSAAKPIDSIQRDRRWVSQVLCPSYGTGLSDHGKAAMVRNLQSADGCIPRKTSPGSEVRLYMARSHPRGVTLWPVAAPRTVSREGRCNAARRSAMALLNRSSTRPNAAVPLPR